MEFEKICKRVVKKFSWIIGNEKEFKKKINGKVSQEFLDSLIFTGMNLEPYEVILFSYIGAIFAFIAALALDILILFFYHFSISSSYFAIILMLLITLLFPLLMLQFISEYPKSKAKQMKIHSLGDIPEVLSYIVMYLKLIPNLENAFRFAAIESETSLGKDLRKLLWDLEIRIHKSIDDAITYFANLWGKWSEYFKRSLHLIRSSVHEKDEGERNATLDRSIDVVLDGTKSMMIDFSNKLHQPTLVIYSIGVMIPLALVAMLPAISLVKMRIKIGIMEIFIFYDIVLPILLYFYIRKILLSRPATFSPAPIPASHPELEKLNKKANGIAAIIVAIFTFFIGFFIHKIYPFFPSSLILLWSFSFGMSTYMVKTYEPYKKIRDDIRQMENEFGDALYVLGKRIMEGRPAEDAFIYASHTLEGSKIGKVFDETAFNLLSMRMRTREALFDEKFGSLRHVYSNRIRAIMKLFVEGIKKSYVAAGVAIVKIADHLKQLQEVEKGIKNALGTLTSTLRTTANLFAPIIAGVTLGITKLIASTISNMPSENEWFAAQQFINVKPNYFVFVIGVYIIELIFILNRLANGIDEGDDRIYYFYNVGKSIVPSVILFTIVTVLSMLFFQGMSPV